MHIVYWCCMGEGEEEIRLIKDDKIREEQDKIREEEIRLIKDLADASLPPLTHLPERPGLAHRCLLGATSVVGYEPFSSSKARAGRQQAARAG